MNDWFTKFLRTNPVVQQSPFPALQSVLDMPQGTELVRTGKPPNNFGATAENDPKRAEFWLENTIRVLDELSCTPSECLKCALSSLKDSAYQWWNTFISIVPRKNVTWEFFQTEFRKKYIS
ncbi:Protein MCM10 [Gossypium australe]|uniref:Protein MCM10 n=1 Tax=Gossypium australe TaxID=47621 RepID=A0A5B6VKZ5_9ROSI|nr:Protein MCM10 [Gossypium australe]